MDLHPQIPFEKGREPFDGPVFQAIADSVRQPPEILSYPSQTEHPAETTPQRGVYIHSANSVFEYLVPFRGYIRSLATSSLNTFPTFSP